MTICNSVSCQVSIEYIKHEVLFVTFSFSGEQSLLHIIFVNGKLWPSPTNHKGLFSMCFKNTDISQGMEVLGGSNTHLSTGDQWVEPTG